MPIHFSTAKIMNNVLNVYKMQNNINPKSYFNCENYEECMECFVKAKYIHPNFFFNCENYEELIDCLEKAKIINPNRSEVLSNFALVCMKKSEKYLAREYLFNVCTIKRYPVDARTDYADFSSEINDLITAEVAYVRVLSLKLELYKVCNEDGKLKLNIVKEANNQFIISNR